MMTRRKDAKDKTAATETEKQGDSGIQAPKGKLGACLKNYCYRDLHRGKRSNYKLCRW